MGTDGNYAICFVCMGNICRSPTAEVVMRSRLRDAGLADRVEVSSAGTGDWHAGSSADRRALAALRDRGYDGSDHVARQFDRSWFDTLDLVIALDSENEAALLRLARADQRAKVRLLRSFDPAASPDDLDVPDPYYDVVSGFEDVLDLVEAGCSGLLDYLRREVA